MTEIKFGTDGWRAIMGKDYTPDNVAKVIQAFCDVQHAAENRAVYVGHDTRRDSASYARLVACVLAANDFTAYLTESTCPTPCVSWMTKTFGALAAVMVTASHNPPDYNGIKFKEYYGGAASPEYTTAIEEAIKSAHRLGKVPQQLDFAAALKSGKIKYFNPHHEYVNHLQSFIAVDKIVQAGTHIAVDAMHGAGAGYMAAVLKMPITSIRQDVLPDFGGISPEPIAKNLEPLREKILNQKGTCVGLATDGDADRIGAMDENGEFVDAHQIFALLLLHHLDYRKLRGPVVKSVSTTQWIDRIGAKYGLEVIETPIGFRHICKILHERDALMGGEESGGISLREHVHERDGVLNSLLLLEMMAVRGRSLARLVHELRQEFGDFHFGRSDYHVPTEVINRVKEKLTTLRPDDVDIAPVRNFNRVDGLKIIFTDDSWLLLRASGTEPLLRIYAEAPSQQGVEKLQKWASSLLTA